MISKNNRSPRELSGIPDKSQRPPSSPDYRLGAFNAMAAAALLALQEPFSVMAAGQLSAVDFLAITQLSLMVSVPLLLTRFGSRREFIVNMTTPANWPKLLALFLIGCAGLLLYDVALSSAHPIITAAVLNLSPFWAALVARVVSGKGVPQPRTVFVGCFVLAFVGAMMLAFSQIESDPSELKRDLLYSLFHSRWALALPMPIFFALSGTLVYEWFRAYDEGAAIACNFVVSAAILIPGAFLFRHGAMLPKLTSADGPAILLLLAGTLASSAAGRVFYQASLTATNNDNGFVTMFFLAIPAMSAGVSWPLSYWIADLHVSISLLFFAGLLIVIAPLFVFSYATSQASRSAQMQRSREGLRL